MLNLKASTLQTLIAVLVIATLVLSACGGGPAPTPAPAPNNFVPLPKPAMGAYGTSFLYSGMGGGQLSHLYSPIYEIKYGETKGTGTSVGKTSITKYELYSPSKIGTMQGAVWGDWQGGTVGVFEYYSGTTHEILGGMVELYIEKATFFQFLTAGFGYVIDRSYVQLIYESPKPGDVPQLTRVIYAELWGPNPQDAWSMGTTATWDGAKAQKIDPKFHPWGFWEYSGTPFDEVKLGLTNARDTLSQDSPSFQVVDRDSAKELIGRQSGFSLESDGKVIGDVAITYDNLFGNVPNGTAIGSGALSRIEWNINGHYYAMLMLTPQISPTPSTLYIFVDDKATADQLQATPHWVNLYPVLRQRQNSHVIAAIHAIGFLQSENVGLDFSVPDGDSTKDIHLNVPLGNTGGVTYTMLTKPTHEEVLLARNLLSLLGKNGIKALGLYFPYKVGSGSGLDYYLAGLVIATAPEDQSLDVWGADTGVIDRVGHPDYEWIQTLLAPQ